MERGWKPSAEVSPACPRCGSSNTKFCYYNNYSLTQPRYFCKGCRRYWTKGGSLRNVPIGGGCRKSRRGKSSVRVSTDGGVGSRSSAHDGIDQSNGQISSDHNHASTSNIDLAAVYANFLNQNPRPDNNRHNVHEPGSVSRGPAPDGVVNSNVDILPVMGFPGFQGFQMSNHLSPHLPHQGVISHGFFDYGEFNSRLPETQLLGGGNSLFFGGPDGFFEKTGNGVISGSNHVDDAVILPPLPGENPAAASGEAGLLWPGSDTNLLQNQSNNLLPNSNDDGDARAGEKTSEVLDGDMMMSPFSALNLEAIFRS